MSKKYVRNPSLLLQPMGTVSTKQIVSETFPNCSVREWNGKDDEGMVFGFAVEISLKLIELEQVVYLLDVSPYVDNAQVAALLRMGKFYSTCSEMLNMGKKLCCVVVTPFITPSANKVCESANVKVLLSNGK
eukprot:TRINITY_DN13245_c0_g1_i1.p1 TRINITY_DN13245_c0_g1~~TRINITY_DN13245_c0_g1_i1.p1  ORF type:complete len:146 (-),score=31.08 TRINITY_DN13245_c0_g1_i1:33-428(-)